MRRYLLLWLLPLWLFGAAKYLSPIPLPQVYFISLETEPCDETCLQEHLERGEIFSFLALISERPEFAERFAPEVERYATLFNAILPAPRLKSIEGEVRIVVVGDAQRFRRTLLQIAEAASAYLLQSGHPFLVETIEAAPHELPYRVSELTDYDLIVAIIPYSQAHLLLELQSSMPIYVPTLHADLLDEAPQEIYYGGLDYLAQIEALAQLDDNPLVVYSIEGSPLSERLTLHAAQLRPQSTIHRIKRQNGDLRYLIKYDRTLDFSDVLLNTPLVTSALILSQLTLYGHTPPKKLSTQINFKQKLFDLTQEHDRKGLYMAISTLRSPYSYDAAAGALGTDLLYDWAAYATMCGIDAILFGSQQMECTLDGHQIRYDTQLLRYHIRGFSEVPRESSQGFLRDDSL